tara:strand:- start:329 stop:589 length:261 start_codon:yes stop_codon:yes gene_type:complete
MKAVIRRQIVTSVSLVAPRFPLEAASSVIALQSSSPAERDVANQRSATGPVKKNRWRVDRTANSDYYSYAPLELDTCNLMAKDYED